MFGRRIKSAILLLACLGSLAACRDRVPVKESLKLLHHRQDTAEGGSTVIRGRESGGHSGEDAGRDTALHSLKATRMVALEAVIGQVWKFEDADKAHWNDIFWDTVIDTRQYPELALFPDHSATANPRCGLKTGKWMLDKESRELSLRFADGTAAIYTVREIALKQMEVSIEKAAVEKAAGPAIIRLSSEGLVHKRLAEDPFYPTNNRWRIKPGKPETREEIRERVKACLHFYSLFFLDNHQRHETDISFSGLPSCFIWYNGGIGVQERSDLDNKWINCFYSSYQAYQGYDMLASLLGSHKLKWPENPTSWVKQTGEVLDQMVHKL
ncbi:hypothetical protein ACX0G9_17185 [Flavitalea flava]